MTPLAAADPALGIALYARLYRLLADRPEFLTNDVGARLDAAWTADAPGSLRLVDRVLVARLTETDRLCGYAVAKLRNAAFSPLLDVLGVLEPERIAGMYFALPRERRAVVLRDPTWAFHIQRANHAAVADAERFWDDMPDGLVSDELPPDAQTDYFDFIRTSQRARAGLHDQEQEAGQ